MSLAQRWEAVMMDNYGTPPLALVSGDGAVVTDVDGKSYLDLVGGIAVNILGHRHPAVIEAVTRQLNTLGHTSNLYATEPGIALAEALVGLLGVDGARVFFCNSGAEANEVAFKITRLTGRTKLVAAQNAFHGRTMGSLALTGQPSKQEPFAPLPGDVTHVPYGDVDALRLAVDDQTAAVFLEPIMGEGGVVTPPAGYLVAAREITAEHGALLVLDEVQTGMGRTGAFFAHQHDGITPDVVTLAKGLGGGLPIGACIATGDGGRAADSRPAWQHIRRQSRLHGRGTRRIAGAGRRRPCRPCRRSRQDTAPRHRVNGSSARRPCPRSRADAAASSSTSESPSRSRSRPGTPGSSSTPPRPNVIRLVPPLILTDAQVDDFLGALPGVLDKAAGSSQ